MERYERTPDGHINNCSVANGDEEKNCQICGGGPCPDRARFERNDAACGEGNPRPWHDGGLREVLKEKLREGFRTWKHGTCAAHEEDQLCCLDEGHAMFEKLLDHLIDGGE
jgi:hypothetical protein